MEITITIRGIDFDAELDYSPAEKEVKYYSDGSGYPGCGASIDHIKITHCGDDFTDFFTKPEWQEVENAVWNAIAEIEPPERDY